MRTIQTKKIDSKPNSSIKRPVYLDCNATAPLEPLVAEAIVPYFTEFCGNAGSRTHEYGLDAKQAVQNARRQIAEVVSADPEEVIFTSGATESNNLAILGLIQLGKSTGKTHIISTGIEHKAVLEPLEFMEKQGFEISLISANKNGLVNLDMLSEKLRPDTLLVSVMHVNNETGVVQPINDIAKLLNGYECYFHVDAAQGYGKDIKPLQSKRIDLISLSSHKIYGPLGVGALIRRRRDYERPPLTPLMYGGGQEAGLRPGTLPVPLIVGFGLASEIALQKSNDRRIICEKIKMKALRELKELEVIFNGDQKNVLPHVLNFSIRGLDSEAVILALKDIVAISNGSACTSQKYSPSHVLKNMGIDDNLIQGAVRLSWSHLTGDIPWDMITKKIKSII